MKPITSIEQFSDGMKIQGFYLCVEKHKRETRNKDLYLDLILRDRSGQISAKIWDGVGEMDERFDLGDPVAVSGMVESFQDRLQLIVKKINRASVQYYGRYGYDPALIVPAAAQDPLEMWSRLTALIRSIKTKPLKSLVTGLYREFKEQILIHPASVMLHHNYRSGYLEHVLSMGIVADTLADHYSVDRDLLLTGVLVHDIGKLHEILPGLEVEYTEAGQFLGHIVMGRDLVRKQAAAIPDFPEKLLQKLEHLILSHQGRYEWQSPVKPKLKEALLLHHIDNMDAKLNLFDKAIEEDQEAGSWTDKRNYFRANLYKGDDEPTTD